VASDDVQRDGFGRPRDDQMPHGGWIQSVELNKRGPHVCYRLLLREAPIRDFRAWCVIVRAYENGMVTLDEGPWEMKA
jgi:hypothetical protein